MSMLSSVTYAWVCLVLIHKQECAWFWFISRSMLGSGSLWNIIFIKRYYLHKYYGCNNLNCLTVVLYVEAKIASPTTGGGSSEECHNGRTSGNLWNPGHAVANIGLDIAVHSSANRSTHISHIIIFPLAKAFAAGNVKSVWSVITVLGILLVTVFILCDQHNPY